MTYQRPRSAIRWQLSALCLVAALVCAPFAAWGQTLDEEARHIAQELQCPVCQGLSVADSPSQLAAQMRGIIRTKLEAGEERAAILTYFAERYGESVLLSPPRGGFTSLVWVAPYAGALVLLGFLVWLLGNSRRSSGTVEQTDDRELERYLAEVDRESDGMREQPIR